MDEKNEELENEGAFFSQNGYRIMVPGVFTERRSGVKRPARLDGDQERKR
jgi:hypothetical protein